MSDIHTFSIFPYSSFFKPLFLTSFFLFISARNLSWSRFLILVVFLQRFRCSVFFCFEPVRSSYPCRALLSPHTANRCLCCRTRPSSPHHIPVTRGISISDRFMSCPTPLSPPFPSFGWTENAIRPSSSQLSHSRLAFSEQTLFLKSGSPRYFRLPPPRSLFHQPLRSPCNPPSIHIRSLFK